MANLCTIALCFLFAITVVAGDEEARSESDLRRALFQDYDKLVRPVKRTTDLVHVRANIIPLAVRDVDVKQRKVKLDTWLFATWDDQYLTWDPTEYGGLTDLRVPVTEVWKPDLAIYSASPDSCIPTVMTNVVIAHNGTVVWVPPFELKSHCSRHNQSETPDNFQCTVVLGSWTYDVTQMDLQEYRHDSLGMNDPEYIFNHHSKWTLESMTASHHQKPFACCTESYTEVLFDLHFHRRAEHHDDH